MSVVQKIASGRYSLVDLNTLLATMAHHRRCSPRYQWVRREWYDGERVAGLR